MEEKMAMVWRKQDKEIQVVSVERWDIDSVMRRLSNGMKKYFEQNPEAGLTVIMEPRFTDTNGMAPELEKQGEFKTDW